ncbi:protein CREG1 [Tanacetum coccineum]
MDMFMMKNGKYVCFLLVMFGCLVNGRMLLSAKDRPKPDNAAPFARWLVSESSWGVLRYLIFRVSIRSKSHCTIADDLGGAPWGNVVSFSDGLPNEGKGIPYFYLTALDPTAQYALKDHRSSVTISEYPLGTCGKIDPENPTCAKITLTGKLNQVDAKSEEAASARTALFAKHAEMKDWPKDHNFQVFKLDIEEIFMINFYGGPKPLTVDQYLHSGMDALTAI